MPTSKTQTKRPTKRTPAKKAPASSASKSQARKEDSPLLTVTAEATPLPVDESNQALEDERAELQQPGQVSGKVAKQIDNDPGYDIDQLTHMAEYWGEDERDTPGS